MLGPEACGRGYIVAPGAVRSCVLECGHDNSHMTIYQLERVTWPNVVLKKETV